MVSENVPSSHIYQGKLWAQLTRKELIVQFVNFYNFKSLLFSLWTWASLNLRNLKNHTIYIFSFVFSL